MDKETQMGIEKLQQAIDESNYIVFFGGAGVSTESGIPDFRSQDGLYHQKYKYPPETIVSHTFLMQKQEDFFEFYKDKMLAPNAKPNAAHYKLAELEAAGKLKAVVTQNIDGLHQAAGSKEVLELHGSVLRNYCMRCKKRYDGTEDDVQDALAAQVHFLFVQPAFPHGLNDLSVVDPAGSGHFQIQACRHTGYTVADRAPVAHHITFKTPFFPQYIR